VSGVTDGFHVSGDISSGGVLLQLQHWCDSSLVMVKGYPHRIYSYGPFKFNPFSVSPDAVFSYLDSEHTKKRKSMFLNKIDLVSSRRVDKVRWLDHGLDLSMKLNWDESVSIRLWGRGKNSGFYFSSQVYKENNCLALDYFNAFSKFKDKRLLSGVFPFPRLQDLCLRAFTSRFMLRGVLYRQVSVPQRVLWIYWLLRERILGEEFEESTKILLLKMVEN